MDDDHDDFATTEALKILGAAWDKLALRLIARHAEIAAIRARARGATFEAAAEAAQEKVNVVAHEVALERAALQARIEALTADRH